MKKILSILGLIAVLGITTPAFAAPSGHGGPGHHGGGPHGGGHRIHAGAHHRPHMAPRHAHYPRHHGGVMIHSGYPRHSHWHGYRHGYWGSSWCDYRLGWCDSYYYPPCRPHAGVYFPLGSAGVSVRF